MCGRRTGKLGLKMIAHPARPAGSGRRRRHRVAPRRLHPGVDREDPERAEQACRRRRRRSRRNAAPLPTFFMPNSMIAEKAGLQEERRQHLVAHQRTHDGPGELGELRPVGAELVRHHEAAHDAHAKHEAEALYPELEQVEVNLLLGAQPQPLEHRQVAGEADRERRQHDMESDGEGELQPRQEHRIETRSEIAHLTPPAIGRASGHTAPRPGTRPTPALDVDPNGPTPLRTLAEAVPSECYHVKWWMTKFCP